VKSNDDNLYAATVRQTLKLWRGVKPKDPNPNQAPGRRQNLNRPIPKRNPWALSGPEDLR